MEDARRESEMAEQAASGLVTCPPGTATLQDTPGDTPVKNTKKLVSLKNPKTTNKFLLIT